MLNLLLHFALDTLMPAARGGHDPVLYARYADNLVVATRTEAEGRELLERIRLLLGDVSLTLKGDPGETRALARGQTLDLLGLRLTSDSNRLLFNIPDHKWGTRRDEDDQSPNLRTKLKLAQREANPTATARALVSGWLMAHGPCFGNDPRKDEETVNRLDNLLRDTGHRDVFTRDQIVSTMRTASKRWERTVAEARTRLTTELTTNPVTTTDRTAHATAVTPTVAYRGMDGRTDDTTQDATTQHQMGGTTGDGSEMASGPSTAPTSPSSSMTTSRPSGRSTALPDNTTVPPSAPTRRARSSNAATARSQNRRPRHRSGRRSTPARPPPRPP